MPKTHPRIAREFKTAEAMIRLYCRDHHEGKDGMCPACTDLLSYAGKRLEACPYGKDKPTCAQCPIHCYRAEMREQIREVMRYAGPRMLWRHPVLAAFHLADGRLKAPARPAPKNRPPGK
jgi:hypothetical protein